MGLAAVSPVGPIIQTILIGATSNSTMTIPAGYGILSAYVRNTTANIVTGGIKIGTTSGATDVVVALAVGASAYLKIPDATLLLGAFSSSVSQTLFVQAVVSWNSASINVTMNLAPIA